ncbi:MAG: 50S ribosomal protein L11 methyltransferase [Acidimicrobiales bacterium]
MVALVSSLPPAVAVIGVADPSRPSAIAAAAELGLVEDGSHRVGHGRSVVSFVWGRERRTPSRGDADADVAAVVRELRRRGIAAVTGPRSAGHAVAWAARNAPVPFGPDACVCFPWTVFDRADFATVVEIDPGAGFGAGGHPTTLLLLERLRSLDLAGRRVLDVGCGTGVLAIAAAHLGASTVTAIDIAPAAVAATERNVDANDVTDRVEVILGEVGAAVHAEFDVVLANIVLDVLVSLAPELQARTAPGGLLAVSGLSPAQPSTLAAELASMVPIWTDERTEWVAIGLQSKLICGS